MRRALVTAAALVAGSAAPASGDAYGVTISHGNGTAPYGFGSGSAFTISYVDTDGLLAKLPLYLTLQAPTIGRTVEGVDRSTTCTTRVSHEGFDGKYFTYTERECVTTERYTLGPPPTAEEWADYHRALDELEDEKAALRARVVPFTGRVNASIGLGPFDTTGVSYEWMGHAAFAGVFGLPLAEVGLGFGVGGFTHRDRTVKVPTLSATGEPMTTTETDSVSYFFAGFPLRAAGYLHRRVLIELGLDLNLLEIAGDSELVQFGSVVRAALFVKPVAGLTVGAVVSGQRVSSDAGTVAVEAMYGF